MTAATITETEPARQAVSDCRAAQARWAARPVRERLRPVRELRRLLVREADALCAAVARDLGKHAAEVIGGEVLPTADACKFLEKQAARLLAPRKVSGRPLWMWGQRDTVHRRPRGVVGIIGTWNYPLFLNGVQIAQAVAAGNGVVWKPSEVAPESAKALFSLVARAGFPEGLVRMLPATREGGAALLEADIDHLVFTGSAAVGRKIAARLGERLVSSTLELSGCDPMFVLPDADVGLAAAAAWFGATLNRGQTCIAVRRAFVHRSLYAEMTRALGPWAKAAGPVRLAMPAQARQAEALLADAVEKGGRLLGGDPGGGFRPSVVLDATPEMDLFREASFAPVLALLPYDDLDAALRANAACPYALGASVFTADPKRAEALAARVAAGVVTVNDVIAPSAHPVTPFGGVRESGWGVTQGAEGLLEMTVPQVVSVKGGKFRPHYDMATKGPGGQEGLLRGLLRFCHGDGLLERWRGFRQMLRGLRNKDGTP